MTLVAAYHFLCLTWCRRLAAGVIVISLWILGEMCQLKTRNKCGAANKHRQNRVSVNIDIIMVRLRRGMAGIYVCSIDPDVL